MKYPLVGSSYPSQSPNASAQITRNWYQENAEDQGAKSQKMLYPSPGTKVFSTLPANSFCELFVNGNFNNYGAIAQDGNPVYFGANQANQICFCSGGTIYIFNLLANTFQNPASAPANAVQVGFTDGYFVALVNNSNLFQLSNSLDGLTWNGISSAKPSVFPDSIKALTADHRELVLLGRKQSVFYYDSGNTFPYDVVPGGFMEQGCWATHSVCKLDNTVFWLGGDERGHGIAYRSNGYTPVRVSNHAIENVWSTYPRTDDAISYTFQDQGHSFWHLYFPSGVQPDSGLPLGTSFRYDAATGMFHDVTRWDFVNGRHIAHQSRCHCDGFNKHLVGDLNVTGIFEFNGRIFAATGAASGKVYEMRIPTRNGQGWDFADDAGNPIRRERIAPSISNENKRLFHSRFQADVETGLGPQPPLQGAQAPTAFTLADANGVLWDVTIDNNGNLNTASGSLNAVQTVFINDANGGSWQLGVNTFGNRTSAVAVAGNYPTSYTFTSSNGDKLFLLTIDTFGSWQTQAFGIVGRDPQLFLSYSDDGGHSFKNERSLNCGQTGQYRARALARRLGVSRDRRYKIACTDPIPWRVIDAYLEVEPGTN